MRHRLHLGAGGRALVRNRRRHRNRVRPVVPGQPGNVRRKAQRHRRHVPRDVADVVRAAAAIVADRPGSSAPTFIDSPCSRLPSSFCSAFASVWSASLHSGIPTFWMLAQVVSATTLLKCCGQALPSTRIGCSSVLVIIAAPFAMDSPMPHSSLIFGYVVCRK